MLFFEAFQIRLGKGGEEGRQEQIKVLRFRDIAFKRRLIKVNWRSRLTVGLLVVAMAALIVGPVSVYAAQKVNISLMIWGGVTEENEVKSYIAAFNKVYPDIQVTIIRPADYWPKLMSMLAAGTPPDVFYMGFPEFVKYHEMGALLDLQSYVNEDSTFNARDFFPGTLNAFRDRKTGDLYGIPKDWSTYVLYYNKKMFKDAGLPTPNEMFGYGEWSWQDFLNVAQKLTKDGVYGFAYNTPGRWKLFPPQAGANWVVSPEKVEVDTPAFAEGIQFLADLSLKYHVAPTATELAEMGAPDWFANQKAAMYICGRWMTMKFKTLSFDWDIAPVPYDRQMYTWVDLVAYCVAKDSKHPEAAWKLANFLTHPEVQKLVAQNGHAIPIRRSVAYSPAFTQALAERGIHNTVHLMPLTTGPITVFDHWGEVWTAINRGLEPVWTGEKTAAEVLPGIQKEIDKIMAGK